MRLNIGLAVVAIMTLFSTGFVYKQPGVDFFPHYAIIPLLFLAGFILTAGAWSRSVVALVAALALHSVGTAAFFDSPLAGAVQQIVGIAATLAAFEYVIRLNGDSIPKLFGIYLKGCVVVSAIGLLQLLSFVLAFRAGYDFDWFMPEYYFQLNQLGIIRLQSIMLEPAHFGMVVAAGIFVAVVNLMGRSDHFIPRWQSGVILTAAVGSFSAIAYAAILTSFALTALYRGLLGRLLCGLVIVAAGVASYELMPDIRLRVDDTLALLLHRSVAAANLSSLTLYNNAHVAWGSLTATSLFGGGLGSHPLSFERFSLLYGMVELPLRFAVLNNSDASALLLRIISELGIPGLLAAALFLTRYYVPGSALADTKPGDGATEEMHWIISNGSLVFLLMALARQGHYFNYGLPFFGLLYLHVGRSYRALAKHHRHTAATWGEAA